MPELILASTSPFRRALMTQTGLPFQSEAPDYEEIIPPGMPLEEVPVYLGEGKARAVADRHPQAVVIGSDQIGECGGRILTKPANLAEARAQLQSMTGVWHRLLTGVVVIGPAGEGGSRPVERFLEVTRLKLRTLTDAELERYLATLEWQGCAGSYRFESKGIHLMEQVEGDHHNIVGLPLVPLLGVLRRFGLSGL